MARQWRVGLAGAGWVTQHHLVAWRSHAPRARVVAICDPQRERARQRATEFGIDQVYSDPDQMLAESRIDALDVAAPREAHADWVRGAARLGVPVLCQKPLAPTLAEAVGLCQEVAGRVRLMVHENWRHRPYYRRIGQWLRAERVGRIVQAQMRLLSSGLLQDRSGAYPILQRQPFIADLQRALVMEVLIHHIDTLRFLFGELRLLHARLGRSCPAMRGEDRAFVLFETAEGAPVALFANLATAGEPPTLTDRLLVIGEAGVIRLSGDSLQRQGKDDEGHIYDLDASYRASYRDTIGHFLDALESGMEFETGPADNLKTLALVEEIYSRS